LALALYLKDNDVSLPSGVITMSAWANVEQFPRLSDPYVGSNDPKKPYISPIYGDFDDFPRLLLQVGDEPVTEDSYTIYDNAIESSVDVKLTKYDGMPHIFQNLDMSRLEVKAAWEEVGSFLNL
jgi:acetyl esterase/lipase